MSLDIYYYLDIKNYEIYLNNSELESLTEANNSELYCAKWKSIAGIDNDLDDAMIWRWLSRRD